MFFMSNLVLYLPLRPVAFPGGGARQVWSTWVGSRLAYKNQNRVGATDIAKHTSLLR